MEPEHPIEDGEGGLEAGEAGILGLDNVRLEVPIAGLGSRTLAILIDYLLLGILQAILITLIVAGGVLAGAGVAWLVALGLLALFAVFWGYFAVFEIGLDGRTPGKAWVGLRVVSAAGGRASPAAILVRSALRPIDGLIGIPFIALDRLARRIGDLVAGTLVVHDRPESAADREPGVAHVPAGWGPREVAVAEGFLRRAAWLEPSLAGRLAGQLLRAIAGREPERVRLAASAGGSPVEVLRRALDAGGAA